MQEVAGQARGRKRKHSGESENEGGATSEQTASRVEGAYLTANIKVMGAEDASVRMHRCVCLFVAVSDNFGS
jgi:hypothetical protein